MKKRIKRLGSLLMAGVLAASLVTGCGSAAGSSSSGSASGADPTRSRSVFQSGAPQTFSEASVKRLSTRQLRLTALRFSM